MDTLPFRSLIETDNPPQLPDVYTPRDTPVPIVDTANVMGAKQKYNPITAPMVDSVEADLKAEGSGTSGLSMTLAILGAAKGDFRGLQAIEESKRRTALAKSIVPEMNKVNTMTNQGKWEEAGEYVNKLVGSYGARADYLVPYFTAMQADIKRKQEGWQNLVGMHKMMEAGGAGDPKSPNYSAYKALTAAIKDKNFVSETNLQGFMTRAKPETQIIDRRKYTTDILTGETKTENFPTIFNGSDFDNFAGIAVASTNNLNTKQLANLHNGLPVKTDKGETINPDSERAQKIKEQFNLAQPINAQLEMAKLVGIPPEAALQLLKDKGLLNVAIRNFGEGTVDKALAEVRKQETEKQIAIIKGTEAEQTIDPSKSVTVHLDESNPDTFLTALNQPVTNREIVESKGKLGSIDPKLMPTLQQNKMVMQSLDRAAEILRQGGTLNQTIGNRLTSGVISTLSSYAGYPITDKTETRQAVRVILNNAIEQIENTSQVSPTQIRGGNSKEIADLKAFAAGNYRSENDVLRKIEEVRERLGNMTKALVGIAPPTTQPAAPVKKGARTPVEVLAPAITKGQRGRPQQSQITRDPYGPGGIQIPPGIEEGIRKAVEATGKAAQQSGKPTGGAVRVEVPNTPQGQPTLSETPKVYSEDDEVAKAMAAKRMQRMKR